MGSTTSFFYRKSSLCSYLLRSNFYLVFLSYLLAIIYFISKWRSDGQIDCFYKGVKINFIQDHQEICYQNLFFYQDKNKSFVENVASDESESNDFNKIYVNNYYNLFFYVLALKIILISLPPLISNLLTKGRQNQFKTKSCFYTIHNIPGYLVFKQFFIIILNALFQLFFLLILTNCFQIVFVNRFLNFIQSIFVRTTFDQLTVRNILPTIAHCQLNTAEYSSQFDCMMELNGKISIVVLFILSVEFVSFLLFVIQLISIVHTLFNKPKQTLKLRDELCNKSISINSDSCENIRLTDLQASLENNVSSSESPKKPNISNEETEQAEVESTPQLKDQCLSPNVNIICMVCENKANGQHCGIKNCCEDCKEFFKDTVQNGRIYTCCADDKIYDEYAITEVIKDNFRYCKYQKCLRKGTILPAVQENELSSNFSIKTSIQESKSQLPEKHIIFIKSPDPIEDCDYKTESEDETSSESSSESSESSSESSSDSSDNSSDDSDSD